jgi:hypothetical protein
LGTAATYQADGRALEDHMSMNITTATETETTTLRSGEEMNTACGSYTSRPAAQTAPPLGSALSASQAGDTVNAEQPDKALRLLINSDSALINSRNDVIGPWDDFWHPVTGRYYRDRALCNRCGRRFDDVETVYITRYPTIEPGYTQACPYPLCEPCAGTLRLLLTMPRTCAFCGRSICFACNSSYRQRFCCKLCAIREANGKVSAKRAARRAKLICHGCGDAFAPARADARYHSNACRQRAYRQRKAAP